MGKNPKSVPGTPARRATRRCARPNGTMRKTRFLGSQPRQGPISPIRFLRSLLTYSNRDFPVCHYHNDHHKSHSTTPQKLATRNMKKCLKFEVLAHDAGSRQCTGGSQRHAPLVNVGNRYAAAHHSSLQAISAREVGLLPLMSWALSWPFRVRSGSMNICELTTMETPMAVCPTGIHTPCSILH